MSDFFSLSTKGQGRIDHFCSVISLGQSFHFAGVGRVNHTLRWPYDQGFHNVPKFPFYGVGVPSSTSNEQDALVLSLLCQCPRIIYQCLKWTEEMAVEVPFMADFAEEGNLHLFGIGITLWESTGKRIQRAAHPGWLLLKLLTKDICEAVIHSGEMWKWAPAESPSKMIPLGCEPRWHNLFALFVHSSCLEPPDWVVRRADTLVCIPCTEYHNNDALLLFKGWRVRRIAFRSWVRFLGHQNC